MGTNKLFMLLAGCKPAGRLTEQHDIFFTIGISLKSIIPNLVSFWPDSGSIHIDAWREVTEVDGFQINVVERNEDIPDNKIAGQLFFLNLGGYKQAEFEEYHYKMLVVSAKKSEAIAKAKQTAFYKHTGFKGAQSHIDDKYGIDVDDVYEIGEILPEHIKEKFQLQIIREENLLKDEWHLGYTVLSKIND